MRIALSHPGTAPFVQNAARALHERGWLYRYHTGYTYRPRSTFGKAARIAYGFARRDAEKQLRRRLVDAVPDALVESHAFWELLRIAANRYGGPVLGDVVWERAELAFDRAVSARLTAQLSAVYAYEHASLATFQRARELGLASFYDMPAPHHLLTSSILDPEYARIPELQTAHYRHTHPQTPRRNRRRDAELSLADYVVCASTVTEESLLGAGVPGRKILRVPYGMPPPSAQGASIRRSGPLRVLYAGTLSVRKGAHHVLAACARLRWPEGSELLMVGANLLPRTLGEVVPDCVQVRGTVPREELYRLYHEADLLVFPTLLDGFGMVLTEALSCGLPVLTTRRAGAADFIEHERNGFIVPPANPDAIARVLEWCFAHPGQLRQMRPACVESARAWQWGDYRRLLADKMSAC